MHLSRQAEDLIASLRNLPEKESVAIERGTKSLENLMDVCLERHYIGRETPEEVIIRNWRSIAGANFAGRCAPEKIDPAGILLIKVPSAVVRRELEFAEDRLMTAIRALPGCGIVKGIALRAG